MQLTDLKPRYERWLEATQDLSTHTVRAYMTDIQALETYLGEDFDLVTLTTKHLYGFLENLKQQGNASTTVRRRMCGLRSFAGWLATSGIVSTNPASDLKMRFAAQRRLPRAVNPTDLRCLLGYLSLSCGVTLGPAGPQIGPSRNTSYSKNSAVRSLSRTGTRSGKHQKLRFSSVHFSQSPERPLTVSLVRPVLGSSTAARLPHPDSTVNLMMFLGRSGSEYVEPVRSRLKLRY